MKRWSQLLSRQIIPALFALMPVLAWAATESYEIDPDHTSIGFSVKHLTVSNVKGNFGTYSGTILFDEADVRHSSVEVSIDTASISTNHKKRDDHLRSADFFDAAKYSKLTFKSKKIEKRGKNYLAVGDLTMHGVTKEISIPFELSGPVADPWGGNKHIGIEGEVTIDRRDWGITWNDTLDKGGLLVGNEVQIHLAVEAVAKKAAAAPAAKTSEPPQEQKAAKKK